MLLVDYYDLLAGFDWDYWDNAVSDADFNDARREQAGLFTLAREQGQPYIELYFAFCQMGPDDLYPAVPPEPEPD